MKLKVSVVPYENGNLRGYANVVLDNKYALEGVKIINGKNGNFVELPKYQILKKDENGNAMANEKGELLFEKKDVFHPITAEINSQFRMAILNTYTQSKLNGFPKTATEYDIDCDFNISNVRSTPFINDKDKTVGLANVVFGNAFVLERAKVRSGENGEYIDLPKTKRQAKDENGNVEVNEKGEPKYIYPDIFHPITSEAHQELKNTIINDLNIKRQKTDGIDDLTEGNTLSR